MPSKSLAPVLPSPKKAAQKANANLPGADCSWDEMKSFMSGCPLITATDGNHGYGVAWLASQLPSPCHVLMPDGSAQARVDRTRKLGAHVEVTSVGYDETVEQAVAAAKEKDWLLVQDTSFDGYEEIPLDIMQGYMTIFHEVFDQIEESPTHVFLQAGVGSFAGGLLAFLRNFETSSSSLSSPSSLYSFVTIVEASGAECLYKSAKGDDGMAEIMTTPCDTIMAGLNCSSPCTVAWPILRTAANSFLCCTDEVAATGMKLAYNPIGDDPQFISGESGAVTLGALYKICCNGDFGEIKAQLRLTEDSRVLLVSTEGDTDPDGFCKIVHGGNSFSD